MSSSLSGPLVHVTAELILRWIMALTRFSKYLHQIFFASVHLWVIDPSLISLLYVFQLFTLCCFFSAVFFNCLSFLSVSLCSSVPHLWLNFFINTDSALTLRLRPISVTSKTSHRHSHTNVQLKINVTTCSTHNTPECHSTNYCSNLTLSMHMGATLADNNVH